MSELDWTAGSKLVTYNRTWQAWLDQATLSSTCRTCLVNINATEITGQAISERLSRLLIDSQVDADGDVYVTDGLPATIWICTESERRWIRFFGYFETDRTFEDRAELINILNSRFRSCQFHTIPEKNRIYGYYFYPYEDELIFASLIRLARDFATILIVARNLYGDDLGEIDPLIEQEATLH